MAREAAEIVKADTLLDQVKNLLDQAERITARAEQAGSLDTALRGIAQVRGVLELLGQVSGQLAGKGATVNVGINLQAPNFKQMSDYELKQFLEERGRPPVLEAKIITGKDLQ